ncbi:MAG: peptide deformylase [Bacteroidota bacterium]
MILPIVAYGDPVLKKKAEPITKDHPGLKELIENMFETMHNASGLGLAAPQVGASIRLFVIDTIPYADEDKDPDLRDFRKVFINAEMLEQEGEQWTYNEGCLSIPGIREDIYREPIIKLKYCDENFIEYIETFKGIRARIIQHEYDHTDGILFTDRISFLRKRLLKNRLLDISKGRAKNDYPMKFPLRK